MRWQDAVMAVAQVVFIVALCPALASEHKPPMSTCLVTGAMLLVCAAALATLALWWSAGAMALTGLCWLTLLAQQLRRTTTLKMHWRKAKAAVIEDARKKGDGKVKMKYDAELLVNCVVLGGNETCEEVVDAATESGAVDASGRLRVQFPGQEAEWLTRAELRKRVLERRPF